MSQPDAAIGVTPSLMLELAGGCGVLLREACAPVSAPVRQARPRPLLPMGVSTICL